MSADSPADGAAPPHRAFASDNWAGVHPEILDALARANVGHAPAYGADAVTEEALGLFREHFGADAEVYFCFNGTGTNVVGLQSLLRPFEAVVCAESAHIHVDECGAPERFLGSKLLTVVTPDGKLTPELAASRATSTTSRPVWCRSPRAPSSAPSTRSTS